MKAKMEAACVERESRRAVAVLLDGSVQKKSSRKTKSLSAHGNKREENTEGMKEYLGKLQELVPFMPKNKRLSKLEVISHVIDYIHDLRETLGLPPCPQSETDCFDSSDDNEDDDATMEDHTSQLVSNQTFKVSLVQGSSSNLSDSDSKYPSISRAPLSSISLPSNTDNTDTSSNSQSSDGDPHRST